MKNPKHAMGRRQRIAFERPCYEGEDCVDPRFTWFATVDGMDVQLVLTANVGFE